MKGMAMWKFTIFFAFFAVLSVRSSFGQDTKPPSDGSIAPKYDQSIAPTYDRIRLREGTTTVLKLGVMIGFDNDRVVLVSVGGIQQQYELKNIVEITTSVTDPKFWRELLRGA